MIVLNQPKANPEEIWKQYIANLNERKFEENYEMITKEARSDISKEEFIERNENIYEGIEMSNMQVETVTIEEEEDGTSKIKYKLTMETRAGNIEFIEQVKLSKDKDT